jgi:hypothetical protein
MESNDRDQLDSMLDDALAGYSGAEPLAGLEDRTLHRVRAMEATRRRPLRWAFAFVAAALVLVAIVMRPTRNAPKPTDVARAEVPAPARPAARVEEPRVARKHRSGRSAARASAPLPKLEQFPAPAPLTAEEQSLRSFVERDPVAAQQLFAQLRKQINEPIQIQPIQIAPLQTDGAQ